ncbi:helix-turn-helix domain-containing protein [Methylobacterium fujisawaense]|uniref:helix-turn-helix domain-containing protein n=1 Tax=Methylobacterium fujisawaense TaxID=107400 RepID=UPI003CC79E9B
MAEAVRSGSAALPVGLLIRNKRRELGLSQDDLARQLGIPQGSISKLERGIGGEQHATRILTALGTNGQSATAGPTTPG